MSDQEKTRKPASKTANGGNKAPHEKNAPRDRADASEGGAAHSQGGGPSGGLSNADEQPMASVGSASGLQPSGTSPGGSPAAGMGSLGSGGGSTAGAATGSVRQAKNRRRTLPADEKRKD
jgi:hypothetical protein